MSAFLDRIQGCPEDVKVYVRSLTIVNEHVRIVRELEGFKNLAFSYGYIDLAKAVENARVMFSASIDLLTR